MLDRVLLSATEAPTTTSVAVTPPARSFLDSSDKYIYILHVDVCNTFDVIFTGDNDSDDQKFFIVERPLSEPYSVL